MELHECNLCKERSYCRRGPVPGSGDINSKICLLGRNPGNTEDTCQKPFVGRAGQKLNEGLAQAGLPRAICWIDNIAKCVTPADVTPTHQCLKICSYTWLRPTLMSMPNLQLIVTLGNQALHYFEPLGTVGELHGTVMNVPAEKIGKKEVAVFVSYHPSAALRSTLMNRHFMGDMKRLHQYLIDSGILTGGAGCNV